MESSEDDSANVNSGQFYDTDGNVVFVCAPHLPDDGLENNENEMNTDANDILQGASEHNENVENLKAEQEWVENEMDTEPPDELEGMDRDSGNDNVKSDGSDIHMPFFKQLRLILKPHLPTNDNHLGVETITFVKVRRGGRLSDDTTLKTTGFVTLTPEVLMASIQQLQQVFGQVHPNDVSGTHSVDKLSSSQGIHSSTPSQQTQNIFHQQHQNDMSGINSVDALPCSTETHSSTLNSADLQGLLSSQVTHSLGGKASGTHRSTSTVDTTQLCSQVTSSRNIVQASSPSGPVGDFSPDSGIINGRSDDIVFDAHKKYETVDELHSDSGCSDGSSSHKSTSKTEEFLMTCIAENRVRICDCLSIIDSQLESIYTWLPSTDGRLPNVYVGIFNDQEYTACLDGHELFATILRKIQNLLHLKKEIDARVCNTLQEKAAMAESCQQCFRRADFIHLELEMIIKTMTNEYYKARGMEAPQPFPTEYIMNTHAYIENLAEVIHLHAQSIITRIPSTGGDVPKIPVTVASNPPEVKYYEGYKFLDDLCKLMIKLQEQRLKICEDILTAETQQQQDAVMALVNNTKALADCIYDGMKLILQRIDKESPYSFN